jgi:hypothetical protein
VRLHAVGGMSSAKPLSFLKQFPNATHEPPTNYKGSFQLVLKHAVDVASPPSLCNSTNALVSAAPPHPQRRYDHFPTQPQVFKSYKNVDHLGNEKIDVYMRHHMVDAHLTVIQTTRVCLLGFGLVGLICAIGVTGQNNNRYRLQCALTGSACIVSTMYYQRLYALRRLPVAMGYSLESNTVAESMRYTNWTIVIAMLGICAYLLRGPFETERAGPFPWWQWEYNTWIVAGPILSSVGTSVGLPGWHASRTARALQLRKQYLEAAAWLGACVCFLCISAFTSLVNASMMLSPIPSDTTRKPQEIGLARAISALWFVYPIVSFVRTVAIVLGAGDWGVEVIGAQRSNDAQERTRKAMLKNAMWMVAGGLFSMARSGYLAMVAAPECKSTIAVNRLTALADGIIHPNDLEQANNTTDTVPLLPQSDLGDYSNKDTDIEVQTRMRLHVPEVTPLCSQGADSTIAIVDICSQALTALGCAALTFTLNETSTSQ